MGNACPCEQGIDVFAQILQSASAPLSTPANMRDWCMVMPLQSQVTFVTHSVGPSAVAKWIEHRIFNLKVQGSSHIFSTPDG